MTIGLVWCTGLSIPSEEPMGEDHATGCSKAWRFRTGFGRLYVPLTASRMHCPIYRPARKFERIAKDLDGYLLRSLSFDHRKSASLTPLSLFRPVDLRCCLLLCDKTRTRDFLTNLFCRFQPATPGKQHQRSPLRFCPSQASSHPYPHFTSPCSHPSTNVYPHALVVHLAVN